MGALQQQIAADSLSMDLASVTFTMGNSDLPDAGIAGGSAHTATAGNAIHEAGADIIAQLADLATQDPDSPLFGSGNAGVVARDGRLYRRQAEERGEAYGAILRRAGRTSLEGCGRAAPDSWIQKKYAAQAHGARHVGHLDSRPGPALGARNEHMPPLVRLAAETGRRPGELVSLKYDCLDTESEGGPFLIYTETKVTAGQERRLPVLDVVVETVRNHQVCTR